jgi:hypothetical protein
MVDGRSACSSSRSSFSLRPLAGPSDAADRTNGGDGRRQKKTETMARSLEIMPEELSTMLDDDRPECGKGG